MDRQKYVIYINCMCMYIMVVIIGIAFTIRDQVLFSWACDISDVIYVGIIDCACMYSKTLLCWYHPLNTKQWSKLVYKLLHVP